MRRLHFFVASASLLIGCRQQSVTRYSSVRDSAGIQIVENTAPSWQETTRWKVSAQPILEVGNHARPVSDQFTGAVAAIRLSDGRIWVGDMNNSRVMEYDSTGGYVRAFGRAGQGPGELLVSITCFCDRKTLSF